MYTLFVTIIFLAGQSLTIENTLVGADQVEFQIRDFDTKKVCLEAGEILKEGWEKKAEVQFSCEKNLDKIS